MSEITASALRQALKFYFFFVALEVGGMVVSRLLAGNIASQPISYWFWLLRVSAEWSAVIGVVSFVYFKWIEPSKRQ
jgi:hypothetical protein